MGTPNSEAPASHSFMLMLAERTFCNLHKQSTMADANRAAAIFFCLLCCVLSLRENAVITVRIFHRTDERYYNMHDKCVRIFCRNALVLCGCGGSIFSRPSTQTTQHRTTRIRNVIILIEIPDLRHIASEHVRTAEVHSTRATQHET